jgi:hypothetical protein
MRKIAFDDVRDAMMTVVAHVWLKSIHGVREACSCPRQWLPRAAAETTIVLMTGHASGDRLRVK